MSIHDKGSIKSHSNNNPRDDNVLGLRSETVCRSYRYRHTL